MASVAYFPFFGGLGCFVNFGTLGALMLGAHSILPWLQYTQRIRICTNSLAYVYMVFVYAYKHTRVYVYAHMRTALTGSVYGVVQAVHAISCSPPPPSLVLQYSLLSVCHGCTVAQRVLSPSQSMLGFLHARHAHGPQYHWARLRVCAELSRRGEGQANIRTADNHRSPPLPPLDPPPTSDHRGEKRNLPLGKPGPAIFGTQTFESQTPPPPLLF